MISFNYKTIEQNHFPDNTLLLKINRCLSEDGNSIFWYYENDAELFTIMCIAGYINDKGLCASLYMPYIPHARMDRVKENTEVFTLKYFAEAINNCCFDAVYVLDPHSYVSEALINRIRHVNVQRFISNSIKNIYETGCQEDDLLLFYPDEGSMKRYSGMISKPYAFGIKNRDWKTGSILGLSVEGDIEAIKEKTILIVDDICSRGGTFYHSAKKLKELGANKIYLYVTHCENTILDGELLNSGLIERVFTTDSIFTKEHEMINVMEVYEGGRYE